MNTKKTEDEGPAGFAFGKHNYILLLAGVALIVLGFILMTGGGSKDPNVFNPEMYDFQRLTLAPILVLIGFGVEIVAIMRKPRD
jgi:membrane-bound ClpP family serine protease